MILVKARYDEGDMVSGEVVVERAGVVLFAGQERPNHRQPATFGSVPLLLLRLAINRVSKDAKNLRKIPIRPVPCLHWAETNSEMR